ncbi:MAG: hypothetical protein OCC46_02815 [Pseudodesulfovibrio sp.]
MKASALTGAFNLEDLVKFLFVLLLFALGIFLLIKSIRIYLSQRRRAKERVRPGMTLKHAILEVRAEDVHKYKQKAAAVREKRKLEMIQANQNKAKKKGSTPPRSETTKRKPTSRRSRAPFAEWERSLISLWHGEILVNMSYTPRDKPTEERTVEFHEVLRGPNGNIYLFGYCLLRKEKRHFSADRIRGKVQCDGKWFFVDDFLMENMGVE